MADGRDRVPLVVVAVVTVVVRQNPRSPALTGIGLQRAGISEPGAVIAEFSEQPRSGDVAQAGEAGDDRMVRVGTERFDDGLFQVSGGGASSVQDGQQRQGLAAVGSLDQGTLVKLASAKRRVDFLGPGVEVVDPAVGF
jgi:hypothetical protein